MTRRRVAREASLVGLQMPLYIGGSVIIESIFRLPGVGLFCFEALTRLDFRSCSR